MDFIELDNGLKIVLENRKDTGLVSIDTSINSGYIFENKENFGVSLLLSRLVTKVTQDYTKQEILDITEFEGGEITTSSDAEYSDITIFLHAKNIEQQIKLLSSILLRPKFEDEEIDRQKKAIKDLIKSIKDNPSVYVSHKVLEYAFAGEIYGNSLLSHENKIDSITKEDLIKCFEDRYTAKNMVVSIVGDIDIENVKAICKEHLSEIKPGKIIKLPKAENKKFYYMQEDNSVEQVNLKLCFNGVGWDSPDYLLYRLFINTVCGGLSSRMFKAMREEDQLVYSFHLNNVCFKDAGILCMNAGTGKGKTEILVPKAINQVKEFINTITDEEVEASITSMEKRFNTASYDLRAVSSFYSYEMLKYGEIETAKSLQNKLRKITKEDLIRIANLVLNSEASFIGIGPKDGVYSSEEIDNLKKEAIKDLDIEKAISRSKETNLNPKWLNLNDSNDEVGDFKESTLSNGLKIVTQHRPDSLVACGYWVGAGAENETKPENGISHMLEHMVFKGTKSYKKGEIDDIIEKKLSSYLNAFTSECKTCYYSYNISSDDIEEISNVLGELVFYPTLSDIEFNGGTREDGSIVKNGEKEVVFEEINRANDTPSNLLFYNIMKTSFGDTAIGNRILGTKDSLSPMTDKELKEYHNKWYVPNNVTYIAIGDVNHDDIVSKIEKMWGDIPYRDINPVQKWDYIGGEMNTSKPEKKMSFMSITFNAVPEINPNYLKYNALSYILGEGKGSILYRKIVDEKQLTNNISVYFDSMKNAGLMMIVSNCKHDNVEAVKKEILETMDNLVITEKDLKSAVLSMKTEKKLDMLTPSDAFVSVGCTYINTGKVKSIPEIEKELDEITVDEVNALLKEMIKSKPTISIVGRLK